MSWMKVWLMTQQPCPKCQGYLVQDAIDDTSVVVTVARCVNCGNIIDPTIVQFRGMQAQQQSPRFHYHPQQEARSRGKYR